jgi:hypothetical protein
MDKEHPGQSITYHLDPFIPSVAGGSTDDGLLITSQSQNMPNSREIPNLGGDEFSSAFDLLSVDAAPLEGVASDSVPFLDSQPQHLPEPLYQAAQQASNEQFSPGEMGCTKLDQSHDNAQTPNANQQELRTVKEMWAAFLRDPTIGLKTDDIEMGKPNFPIPPSFQQSSHPPQHVHRRSRSHSIGTNSLTATMGQTASHHSHMAHQQQPWHRKRRRSKSPPTAQDTLYGGTNVIKKLKGHASKIDGDKPMAGAPVPADTGLATPLDNLRSYEEGALVRKPPVLKLPVIQTRDLTGSSNSNSRGAGSIVFPSISQSTPASVVGGSYANPSIQWQQRPPTNLDGEALKLPQVASFLTCVLVSAQCYRTTE